VRRVLLVADDRAALRKMRLALRQAAGMQLVATVDGRQSVRSPLRQHSPDVVVVDEMCQRSYALARIFETAQEAPHVHVVLFARRVDASALADAFDAGADAAIFRGLEPAALAVLLHEVVHGRIIHNPRAARGLGPGAAQLRPAPDQGAPWARTIA
jgi:DNA-binding NarL/FixJ family response regulator